MGRYRNGGPTLTFINSARCTPVHDPRCQVDPAAVGIWHPAKPQYRVVTRSRVESNEDEARQVPIDLRPMPRSVPVPAERASQQRRNFTAVQVPLPGSWLGRKTDGDEPVNLPFFPTPPKGRA
jgi:hypothetical protein